MTRSLIAAALAAVSMTALVLAQNDRPMSPTGTAAAQVLGTWVKPARGTAFALGGENYEGGKWIVSAARTWQPASTACSSI